MAKPDSPIHELVSQLPEIYQPILGYPQYDAHASRAQDRRLDEVLRLHDALAELKGRPLNVLDLGCAQGYFSLSLAGRGARVRGIDYLEANIAVCLQLGSENPHLLATFEVERIEAIIESLQPGQYDLVLGLSVFHHLVYLHGAPFVQALLQRVAASGACLLAEMALAREPLYWAPAQPEEPSTLLEGIAFVRCLGRFPTHLSDIQRPLYMASADTWYLGGRAVKFESSRKISHDRAQDVHRGTRAYYFAAPLMAKKFVVEGELGDANRNELDREAEVLGKGLPGMRLPRLLESAEAHGEKWLIREMIPGRLLSEVLDELDVTARGRILAELIGQLAALEAQGLFHSDLRVWNVLADDHGEPRLIDYGAVSADARDCLWPYDVHLCFLIFAQELVSGEIALSDPLRRVALSPGSLSPALQAWASNLFERPLSQWTFELMAAKFDAHWNQPEDSGIDLGMDPGIWLALLEQASQLQLQHAKHLRAQIETAEFEAVQREKRERSLAWSEKEEVRLAANKRSDQLHDELQGLRLDQGGIRAEQADIRAEQANIRDEQASIRAERAGIESQFSQLREEIFDGIRSMQAEILAAHRQSTEVAIEQMSELVVQVSRAGHRADGFDVELASLREEVLHGPQSRAIQVLQEEIAIIKASRSWRMTAPLRSANLRLSEWKLKAKIRLRPMAVRVARRMLVLPGARRYGRLIVSLHPRLASRLQRFLQGAGLIGVAPAPSVARATVPAHGIISRRAAVLSVRVGLESRKDEGRESA